MSNYFAALDIGASKIVCLRGKKGSNGLVSIGSIVTHVSEGVGRGEIKNKKIFIEDLSSTIYEAEKAFSHEVSEIAVNISTALIKHKQIKVFKKFSGKQVTEKDLETILAKVKNKIESSGGRVIKTEFLYHDIEGMGRVKEPEYMFVNGLTSVVGVVYVPEVYTSQIEKLFTKSHMKASQFILSSEASASCCLSKEDKIQGVVFLDIGAGNTDYVTYEGGSMSRCGVVPLGGSDITKDIATYFNLGFESAEKIKIEHGNLVGNKVGQYVKTQSLSGKNKVIDKKLLREIISARLEEIINVVIDRIGTKRQGYNFVLTGGGSNISGLEVFLSKECGISGRVISPSDAGKFVMERGGLDKLCSPGLSTACGLLRFVINQNKKSLVLSRGSTFTKLFRWIKENF